MSVKLVIMHDDKPVSVYTLRETIADAFLEGEIITAEFGAYDANIPACCHMVLGVKYGDTTSV